MKLSEYAKQQGISYKTAWRWFQAGQLDAYQAASGTVIVRDPVQTAPARTRIALYARVSSADQKEDLVRQLERLRTYAAARGYQVAKEVSELASGLNDHRPKFTQLLADSSITLIVVEHKDRATRFGWNYLTTLLQVQGRTIEAILPTDTNSDLIDDFVSVITSMAARLYGQRGSKRKAARIKTCVEQVMQETKDEEEAGDDDARSGVQD